MIWAKRKSWPDWEDVEFHYLLATALRLLGNTSEATAQYREAQRVLEEVGKEQGAEHLSERYDLKPIYADSGNTRNKKGEIRRSRLLPLPNFL